MHPRSSCDTTPKSTETLAVESSGEPGLLGSKAAGGIVTKEGPWRPSPERLSKRRASFGTALPERRTNENDVGQMVCVLILLHTHRLTHVAIKLDLHGQTEKVVRCV